MVEWINGLIRYVNLTYVMLCICCLQFIWMVDVVTKNKNIDIFVCGLNRQTVVQSYSRTVGIE